MLGTRCPPPLFSVVMCFKNGMPYLPDVLQSVASQTYRNFELAIRMGA
jgi:glycosyltransferase involved in cell wall biosynthesis